MECTLTPLYINDSASMHCILHSAYMVNYCFGTAECTYQRVLEYLVKGALVHKRATMAPLDAPRWGRPETTLLICFLPLPEV